MVTSCFCVNREEGSVMRLGLSDRYPSQSYKNNNISRWASAAATVVTVWCTGRMSKRILLLMPLRRRRQNHGGTRNAPGTPSCKPSCV